MSTKPTFPPELQQVYRLIETDLEEVERQMRLDFSSSYPFVEEVVQYGLRFVGKRLRPVLVLLCGRVFGPLTTDHYLTAAALEMIHTASLLHDDILDGAKVRRHLATMNIRWNSATSILGGDLLLAQAMRIMTRSEDFFGYKAVTDAVWKTCESELRQIGTKRRFDVGKEEYFSIVSGKTAAILSCCCALGAHFGGAKKETVRQFAEFGEKLGIAFQIIDDVLDLIGEENIAGKTLGTDLIEKKLTLPLILFLESSAKDERQAILDLLEKEEITPDSARQLAARLKESGAVDAAQEHAVQLIEAALQSLEQANLESPNPDAARALTEIARFVLRRNH